MKFIDLNKEEIRFGSDLVDDFYLYSLGNPVEITSIKKFNNNNLMSSISAGIKEDKLMIKYCPINKIHFSKCFIDCSEMNSHVSFDIKDGNIYIGKLNEFKNTNGILAFSGYLSLNNFVEEDRYILCNNKLKSTIMNKIRVLSLGVRGDKLFGLFYIPSTKGINMSVRGRPDLGISPSTYKTVICNNYFSFSIKDWFDKAKIMEL